MSENQATHDESAAGAHIPDVHGTSVTVEGTHGSTADHGDGHGHDDHGHAEEPLGRIDWPMWGVGILGVALALAVTAALVLATGFSFSA
jgi:hypothetical protein